jgi:hypothetical protein
VNRCADDASAARTRRSVRLFLIIGRILVLQSA